MISKHLIIPFCLTITTILCISCNDKKKSFSEEREHMEATGALYLDSARSSLAAGAYDKARTHISNLREKCPRAISARRAGILLLDSIEIAATEDELHRVDSLMRIEATNDLQHQFDELCQKVKFYNRKLQHDKSAHLSQQQN